MAGDQRPSPQGLDLWRPAAILLMIAGAAGFVFTRVMFGDQVLCLFGSTLVTFGGLALLWYARRGGGAELRPKGRTNRASPPDFTDEDSAASLPRWEVLPPAGEEPQTGDLTNAVIHEFEAQGAQVQVDLVRAGRSILYAHLPGGEFFTVMVNQGLDAVDLGEVRALLALVNNNGSQLGYYVTAGEFTPRTLTWASSRPVLLIARGQVSLIFEG